MVDGDETEDVYLFVLGFSNFILFCFCGIVFFVGFALFLGGMGMCF